MPVPKYYQFPCPWCGEPLQTNNVVFRCQAAKASSKSQRPDEALIAYRKKHRLQLSGQATGEIIDPAFCPDSLILGKGNYLEGIRFSQMDGERKEAGARLCPYCHNPLYNESGKYPSVQLAVLGGSGAGKTAYLTAMLGQLYSAGFSLHNASRMENGEPDEEFDKRLISFRKGGIQLVPTEEENHPIAYLIDLPKARKNSPFFLVLRDFSGKDLQDDRIMRERNDFISWADIYIILLDVANLKDAPDIARSLKKNFRQAMEHNKPYVAMVLFKADRLRKSFPRYAQYLDFSSKTIERSGIPLDEVCMQNNEFGIKNTFVKETEALNEADKIISQLISPDHCRWFIANALHVGAEKAEFIPNGCDTPLLWALTRKGYYPAGERPRKL